MRFYDSSKYPPRSKKDILFFSIPNFCASLLQKRNGNNCVKMSAFGLFLVRMRENTSLVPRAKKGWENTNQKNSEYGHDLRSE